MAMSMSAVEDVVSEVEMSGRRGIKGLMKRQRRTGRQSTVVNVEERGRIGVGRLRTRSGRRRAWDVRVGGCGRGRGRTGAG